MVADSDTPLGAISALAQRPASGLLVHRRFEPLFATEGLRSLLRLPEGQQSLSSPTLLEAMQIATDGELEALWAEQCAGWAGSGVWRRVDGSTVPVKLTAERVDWGGETAVALSVTDASSQTGSLAAFFSHECRTPLQTMLGQLQLLKEAPLPPGAHEFASGALAACRRLLHHVDDFLDMADPAAASMLTQETFEIGAALTEALEVSRDATQLSDSRVLLAGDLKARFVGVERRVRRIAVALLDEALLRKPPAAVILEATPTSEGLRLMVRAPGAGAPDGPTDRAFAPLDIASHLANAMAGSLKSGMDEFGDWRAVVTLPLARAEAAPARTRDALDILVVEDNRGNRVLIEQVLIALGHRPHLAESGFEGVAMAAERPFDLVLMDLSMPGMDGFEASRRIRAMNRPWAGLPIAALTASAGPGVQEAAEEAGMDAFLQKPLEIAQLAEMISLLTRPGLGSVEPAELDQVKQEDDQQEPDDQIQRSHETPQGRNASRA